MVARYAKLAGFTISFHASDLRNVYQSVPSEFARNVATKKKAGSTEREISNWSWNDDHRHTALVVIVMVSENTCQNSMSSPCSVKTTLGWKHKLRDRGDDVLIYAIIHKLFWLTITFLFLYAPFCSRQTVWREQTLDAQKRSFHWKLLDSWCIPMDFSLEIYLC